jgi:acyl carrier protein
MKAHEQETCELELATTMRDLIVAKFQAVAAAQGKPLAGPLTDELVLLESGLDSLCFAIIVATLEDELGCDPFTEAEDVYFPVTFGDFVRFYERAR